MKQKEKWAKEYCPNDLHYRKECDDSLFKCGANLSYREGWLAGFEFAKHKLLQGGHEIIASITIQNLGEKEIVE